MTPPPLLALSRLIVDFVTEADGNVHPPRAGGAGLYAALGMAAWWPRVALVTGVGEDLAEITGDIASAYGLAPEGLMVRDPHCIQSELSYHADGDRRTERAVFGPEHFERMDVRPRDVPSQFLPARGTYLFRDGDRDVWSDIEADRQAFGTLLWEVDERATREMRPADFADVARLSDIVSLNLAEARDLLGPSAPTVLLQQLTELAPGLFVLRMGGDGALVAGAGFTAFHVTPPPSAVIDVTGGGNAFSGGFLAGLCLRPEDPIFAARCAAASAACALAQRGPPPPPDKDLLDNLCAKTGICSVQPASSHLNS